MVGKTIFLPGVLLIAYLIMYEIIFPRYMTSDGGIHSLRICQHVWQRTLWFPAIWVEEQIRGDFSVECGVADLHLLRLHRVWP